MDNCEISIKKMCYNVFDGKEEGGVKNELCVLVFESNC